MRMDELLNILIPILIIGGIFAGVIADSRKNAKKNVSLPKQPANNTTESEDLPFLAYELNDNNISTPTSKKIIPPIKDIDKNIDNNQNNTTELNVLDDIRRAIIAHEILKRKF